MTPVIELRDVSFTYPPRRGAEGDRPPFALGDLSVTVSPGEILGVVGPNASGKTTLIRLLSRLLTPDRGDILLEGRSMARLSRAAVATRVGVVPQDVPAGFPYSVEDLVLMGRFPHAPGRFFESGEDRRIAREAMDAVGVGTLRAEPCDRLSGGERQRVMLARALAQRPRLLVLDEPTAHLDLRYQAECVALLRDLHRGGGLSVVLVSHDLDLAAHLCHRLLLLAGGRPVRLGPPEAVLEEETLAAVYGCAVSVEKHPRSGRPSVRVVWPDTAAPEGG
jgi:iron complex transport system ATP-binding protein